MAEDTAPERTAQAPDDSPNDGGASRARWVAVALIVALVLWMGSGFVLPAGDETAEQPAGAREVQPIAVGVTDSAAAPVTQFFVAEGQAQPDRDAAVRAEATGEIAALAAARGDRVSAGDLIAQVAPGELQEDLARAEEERRRALRDFENAEELLNRGVATGDRVAQTRAALAAAEAQLAAAREALRRTEIRAPFDGRLESLDIAEGEFVTAGQEVGRVVDTDPLTVAIRVPQQALSRIEVGQPADVSFITGETRSGTVTFVGRAADSETRTFAAEITVDNADGSVPAGVSAQVRIPTGEVSGHFLSPAILSLAPDGTLGIKTVEEEDRVAFHPVEIVRAQTDGIWVTGLPDETRIITVGQGFVSDGERVAPSPAPGTGSAP